ncbi:hypothetical protein ACFVGN_39650, partial [Streptomyces sp. NPDC057757]
RRGRREARRREIPTIAVDMPPDAPAFQFADATLTISTRDTDAITDALGDVRPAVIVSGASDAALATWHALTLRYGTAYVYPESALAAGDKAAFHEITASDGEHRPGRLTVLPGYDADRFPGPPSQPQAGLHLDRHPRPTQDHHVNRPQPALLLRPVESEVNCFAPATVAV